MTSTSTVVRRININLTQEANAALAEVMLTKGQSMTDTINRALQVYAFVEREIRADSAVLIREADGTQSVVQFI